ncbi:MAG: YciI family protein [Pyrinomonadaceae bacterium]|nr:YciI family protein [Pyrinomonadaceae bacterium]
MPTYLLFLHEDPSVFERVSPEEMQAIIQKYSRWKQRMLEAGALTGGEKLQDGTGRVLRRTGGQAAVTDGPYTESKEVIGGFFQIRADNYEQAVQAASDCPHLEYGTIEIREVEPVTSSRTNEER